MKTIFCPVDFFESSSLAAEWAVMIAIKNNSKVILFNGYYPFDEEHMVKHPNSINPVEEAKTDIKEKLLSLKDKLCRKYKVQNLDCDIKTDFGIETNDIIVNAATSSGADLIVMGTEGADKYSEIVLGSHTVHVLNNTNIPMLIVPESADAKLPQAIVYASDLKSEDTESLAFTLSLAKSIGANVIFLHVREKDEQSELARLQQLIVEKTSGVSNGVMISFDEVVLDLNLYATIQGYANNKDAGLIVLGQHPRNFFQKLVKGDFTRLMALFSFIPLLVFHKKD